MGMNPFAHKLLLILVLAVSHVLFGVELKVVSPRKVMAMTEAEVGTTQVVLGVVTFVSGVDGRFVVAPVEKSRQAGVIVYPATKDISPALGDVVECTGVLQLPAHHKPTLVGLRLDLVRHMTLEAAPRAKQADFRRGLLHSRRVSLQGTIIDLRAKMAENGTPITELSLFIDAYTAVVRVPGTLSTEEYVGRRIRAVGLVVNQLNSEGRVMDAQLEVTGLENLAIIQDELVSRAFLVATIVFGVVLLFVVTVLLVLWRRGVRIRREMAVIAAERRRMAADLHDTIEQHLAGANLLVAGVLALDNVPSDVVDAMKTMSGVLANAKSEVRSVVMNLRMAGTERKPIAEAIKDVGNHLAQTGLRVRKLLRGLPEEMPAGAYQDLVLIVREAATNAVKHGKAKQVVFTSDPLENGGFVLRISNDGQPFELATALGPEAGHYGLSGMKERALRNRFDIRWGVEGRWTFVEVRVEG